MRRGHDRRRVRSGHEPRVGPLLADPSYYVVVSATLKPLSVEDAAEVEGWLSGEVEGGREAPFGLLTGLPHSLFDAPDREAVRPIIHIRGVHPSRIEVQIRSIRITRTTRPVVAVATPIVQRGIDAIAVAG